MTCNDLLQWGLNNMRVQGWFSQVAAVLGGGALFCFFVGLLCCIVMFCCSPENGG